MYVCVCVCVYVYAVCVNQWPWLIVCNTNWLELFKLKTFRCDCKFKPETVQKILQVVVFF